MTISGVQESHKADPHQVCGHEMYAWPHWVSTYGLPVGLIMSTSKLVVKAMMACSTHSVETKVGQLGQARQKTFPLKRYQL